MMRVFIRFLRPAQVLPVAEAWFFRLQSSCFLGYNKSVYFNNDQILTYYYPDNFKPFTKI